MMNGLHTLAFLAAFLIGFTAVAQTPDPGLMGSYAVSQADYDLGDLAFQPDSFPNMVEVRGNVHYPTTLSAGPFPVLVFMHGRHSTCFETSSPGNTSLNWPCPAGEESITSFEGYDYLAQQLASHGYIVISISVNAINADDNSLDNSGMYARAEVLQHHLDLWNDYNTVGGAPFGTLFVGALDLQNVGTLGHSRGGEGVVTHAVYNQSLGSPYGVNAVLALAPVDFLRPVLNDIPLMMIESYCDGDVSDLQGVHYYDDARYSDPTDETPKYTVLVLGGNHNFYNTVWTPGMYPAGTSDDWDDIFGSGTDFCGTGAGNSGRLTPADQQAVLTAYASAFFRYHIGGETQFAPILEVDDIVPPASSTLGVDDVFVSYHPPASMRLGVNLTDNESRENTNNLVGQVLENGLAAYDICGDDPGEADCISGFGAKEPHSGSSSELGLAQLGMEWDDLTDWYQNAIPAAYQDVSAYDYVQFRTSVDFTSTTSGTDIDFTVVLEDALGATGGVQVDSYSNVLYYPHGNDFLNLPKIVYNTVKIPLSAFAGVDLTQVEFLRFEYDQTNAGALFMTDLMVSSNNPVVGVEELEGQHVLSIYPNPTNGMLYIDYEGNDLRQIDILDLTGRVVLSQRYQSSVDVSNLPSGVYILEGRDENGMRLNAVRLVRQ